MLAQVSLTPTESKKLIGKAVAVMEPVKSARKRGLVVMHPSSSTYFVVEAITGDAPPTNVWLCGAIVPKGACGEIGIHMGGHSLFDPSRASDGPERKRGAGNFPFSWVLRKGAWAKQETLGELLEQMGPEDVYIKGVNALDASGNVGVLWGNDIEGGSAALVMKMQRKRGFKVVYPTGLEKLIPGSIQVAAKNAKKFQYDYAMGVSCGLLPVKGEVLTELKAIELLSGAQATVISAGGVGGADGAVTMVIKGEERAVRKAVEHIEDSKGAKLPAVRLANCADCPNPLTICTFRLSGKPWVQW